MRAIEVAHGATTGALVGLVALDPFAGMRSAPDWSGWLTGVQRLDRVMSRVAPPLFLSATACALGATVVAAVHHEKLLAAGRALATGATATAIAVTLVNNDPLNVRIRQWNASDVPPEDWGLVRAGWERSHRHRQGLIAAAGTATLLGQMSLRRQRVAPRSRSLGAGT